MQSDLIQRIERDPFRVFFPIGLAFAVWAAMDWIFFGFGLSEFYPGQSHADLMFGGFLVSFILGFLMTAIPRFTGANFASAKEILTGLVILSATLTCAFIQSRKYLLSFVVLALLFLIGFASSRFTRRKSNPPYTFIFVGIGLVIGVVGFCLMAMIEFDLVTSPTLLPFSRALAYQGMVLSLILGVGGRLIAGILGWEDIVQQQRAVYENQKGFLSVVPRTMLVAGVIFMGSFLVEFFASTSIGRLMRLGLTGWIAFGYWRILSLPKTRTPHTWIIWSSSWMILMGGAAHGLSRGEWGIAGLHLLFVGGFSLLTLMIASRVILAHGSDGLGLEQQRLPYWLPGGLILLAAITRWLAPIAPDSYVRHLGYAAGCLISGMLIWGIFFIPRTWK
jgi:uncharacterized protein involved in response to NO